MSEATEQMALFDFLNRMAGLDAFGKPIPGVVARLPLLRYAFHPANERQNKLETIKAARMGARAGVWDVWLPVRNRAEMFGYRAGLFVGLVIEMKSERGRLSPEQVEWREHLRREGWACQVYREWMEAASTLVCWVGGEPSDCGLVSDERLVREAGR